jgi:hypothetical protein
MLIFEFKGINQEAVNGVNKPDIHIERISAGTSISMELDVVISHLIQNQNVRKSCTSWRETLARTVK